MAKSQLMSIQTRTKLCHQYLFNKFDINFYLRTSKKSQEQFPFRILDISVECKTNTCVHAHTR